MSSEAAIGLILIAIGWLILCLVVGFVLVHMYDKRRNGDE